jgi:thiamine biosynthesis lipoprotein
MTRVLVPQLAEPPARPIGGAVLALAGETMGTTWSVKLVAPPTADARALTAMAQRELDSVVRQMSPWEPLSDLSRYNRAAAGSWTPLPPAFAQVLRCALQVAEATDGAFDPTLGAWSTSGALAPARSPARRRKPRTSPGPARPPAGAASSWTATACSSPAACAWTSTGSPRASRSTRSPPRSTGPARARTSSRSGASCAGPGAKPDGQPWWVELERPPVANDGVRTLVALHGLSVATSGDYRRFFEHDGRRYAHTLDPATAAPVPMRRSASRCWTSAACAPTPTPRP